MEKVCLELKNIKLSYLDKTILAIPSLKVYQFDRIGIVGKNGAGKTTLLKLMQGQITADEGQVNRFIDFACFDQLAEPADSDMDYKIAGKLSVPQKEINKLSGGEQTRMKLAQLFSTWHEGLLIDEPTTHLDEEGIQFFIDELTYYYGALVLVSHDRYVLDHLVTKIWELENGTITEYSGNYSDYMAQKSLLSQQQQEQYEMYIKEKTRLINAAEKKKKNAVKITQANSRISKKETKAKANKMFMTKSKGTSQKAVQRAAKAIEQRIEQMGEMKAPDKEQMPHFHQPAVLKLHNNFPIMADRVTLTAGDKLLLKEVSFQFPVDNTIAITGANGTGKTTLIHHILNRGEGIILSPKAVIGSYEQKGYEFEGDETVLSFMKNRSENKESKIRSVLHSMNFSGNDLKKNVHDLSGGEAIRLVLCQLFSGRYNILILDEPTNFLDISCIEALERFINAYEGTVILVSHDRMFVDRVADHIYVIEKHTLKLRK